MFTEARGLEGEDRSRLVKHALGSEKRERINAMIALAEAEPGIAIDASELDSSPMLLNCQNGTIDLTTGDLRPHRREDLCTKIVPIAYDAAAVAPTFVGFLRRVLGENDGLATFVQRMCGYSLTADVGEQCLFFLHGLGANGKSTLLTVLLAMMGDYARQAAPDFLLAKRGESHPCDVADLCGTRLVVCTEVEKGRAFAEVTIKQLTGGDRIKARFMRENFFEFEPTFKVVLAANHKPTVRGTDHAIWRRLRLVPFVVHYSPTARRTPRFPPSSRPSSLASCDGQSRAVLRGSARASACPRRSTRRRGATAPRWTSSAPSSPRSARRVAIASTPPRISTAVTSAGRRPQASTWRPKSPSDRPSASTATRATASPPDRRKVARFWRGIRRRGCAGEAPVNGREPDSRIDEDRGAHERRCGKSGHQASLTFTEEQSERACRDAIEAERVRLEGLQ